MTADPDLNFCSRCGKPIWHADAAAIHTCTPPDKTRQGKHWDGCEETRGHHDCAIRKIAALRSGGMNSWASSARNQGEQDGHVPQETCSD